VILFEGITKSQKIPAAWKQSFLVPLYKGKGNFDSPVGYRPLSITSIGYRLYMKCLTKALMMNLERMSRIRLGVLSDSQMGFRTGRGCYEAIFMAIMGFGEGWDGWAG
jgi:hypothetical protein